VAAAVDLGNLAPHLVEAAVQEPQEAEVPPAVQVAAPQDYQMGTSVGYFRQEWIPQ
jgi:hypothetical protein